jgi:hypothetical protein
MIQPPRKATAASAEKRKFNPDGPRKKPFYDTKRNKLVIPATCNGNDASGMPASGMEASGIPAAGERSLDIERKWQGLAEVPTDTEEQNKLGLYMLNEVRAGRCTDPGMFAASLGINPYKFKGIAADNEYFKDCLEIASYIIGESGYQDALDRKKDGNVFMRKYALYNRDYRQMIEDMKAKESARVATQAVVVMERIPDSPLVPLLRKDENG